MVGGCSVHSVVLNRNRVELDSVDDMCVCWGVLVSLVSRSGCWMLDGYEIVELQMCAPVCDTQIVSRIVSQIVGCRVSRVIDTILYAQWIAISGTV